MTTFLNNQEPNSGNIKKTSYKRIALIILGGVFLAYCLLFTFKNLTICSDPHLCGDTYLEIPKTQHIKKFTSKEEFIKYLKEGGEYNNLSVSPIFAKALGFEGGGMGGGGDGEDETAARFSETNIQTPGIDEPDIVKTDGKNIYFSRTAEWEFDKGEEINTKIIKAFPPVNLDLINTVPLVGNLFFRENLLIILKDDRVFGLDVSDPSHPINKWVALTETQLPIPPPSYFTNFNSYERRIIEARLYKDKLYILLRSEFDQENPCPLPILSIQSYLIESGSPVSTGTQFVKIDCEEIYHPVKPIEIEAVYTILAINPASGEIESKTSFAIPGYGVNFYMSEKAIYLTYPDEEAGEKFLLDFFQEKGQELFPSEISGRIKDLKQYNLGKAAQFIETQNIVGDYIFSLKNEDKEKIRSEFLEKIKKYYQERKRELVGTNIVKIRLDNLTVVAEGKVPGDILDQFSIDEYNGYLRIATTVWPDLYFDWYFLPKLDEAEEMVNDIYILDGDLQVKSSIKDLGLAERIYSARFVGDKGYLVTFREMDPFYVLDLSIPLSPQLKGELKIPGYSSYLHPLSEDKILGVGIEIQEDIWREGVEGSEMDIRSWIRPWRVKISLFDVSSPENPQELDKYILEEQWTEVNENHHAFLLDKKHQVFFLPAGNTGYVFSYKDNKLNLMAKIEEISAKRAVYLDDHLYIIGYDKIVVFDERNWKKINELFLTE